jgi:hypothetical protein
VREIRLLHQVSSSGARDPAPPSGSPSSTTSSCSSKLPLLGRRPLSLSHHSSPSSSTAQGVMCHDTLTTARSSSSRRTSKSGRPCRSTRWFRSQAGGSDGSSLKRDGGGARRWQGVCGRAVEALPLLPSPRRPHCSNCATVKTLPLLDGGPRRSGNRVYLNGRWRARPDLRPTCLDLGSDFLFLKNDFRCRLGTTDIKNHSFFISYKWYRPEQSIPKIGYRLTLKTYSVVMSFAFDL